MKLTAEHKRFHLWVMGYGCCVCSAECVFHHVSLPHPLRREHFWGAGLCHEHHSAYHDKLGSVEAFEGEYGINLDREATRNYWLWQTV